MTSISKNGIIVMTRGDSLEMPLFINAGTQMNPNRYTLKDNPSTKVYLGVMEPNQRFEEALIRKTFTNDCPVTDEGDLIIDLLPEETEQLLPGKYYYQIKVLLPDGKVNTIVPKTLLYIMD